MPLHSSLGDRVGLHLQKKRKLKHLIRTCFKYQKPLGSGRGPLQDVFTTPHLGKFLIVYKPQETPCKSLSPPELLPHLHSAPTSSFLELQETLSAISVLLGNDVGFSFENTAKMSSIYVTITKWTFSKLQTRST